MSLFGNGKYGGSDLALERMRAPLECEGVLFRREEKMLAGKALRWERIRIFSQEGAKAIGRPEGNYNTLSTERMDKLTREEISEVAREIADELKGLHPTQSLSSLMILVVGLGNMGLTPDSVGPRAASMINATLHVSRYDEELFESMNCAQIAVIAPGVRSESGIDAADAAGAICEVLLPDLVIAIDSLAARDISRLGTTVQISDTGIFPGSGIGGRRMPINEETMGAPVISIGIPTVISASDLCLGECDAAPSDLFVSPTVIDAIAKSGAEIISKAVNMAFGII